MENPTEAEQKMPLAKYHHCNVWRIQQKLNKKNPSRQVPSNHQIELGRLKFSFARIVHGDRHLLVILGIFPIVMYENPAEV